MIEDIVNKIFLEKIQLESMGFSPRVIIIQEGIYNKIHEEWVGNIKELPWGDTLSYEVEKQKERNIFLTDGSLFNLWIIKSQIIEGFKIY